jgi:hypothetical protein
LVDGAATLPKTKQKAITFILFDLRGTRVNLDEVY